MKFNKKPNDLTIESSADIGSFSFKLDAKAYQILSDGIYSDKIQAVIRELSTNAYDAQIEANNDIPFEVHLPKEEEEYFSIRDFGTGMSEEKILKIYTKIFSSSKDKSDKYNGMLGIGKLSPFSYHSRSFSITSYYNGKTYTYHFFLSESGIPSYTKIEESDTTEPNGVKVTFPVAHKDIREFENTARFIYEWFKTKPKINTGLSKIEPLFNYKKSYLSTSFGGMAVMGNVAYPIDINNIDPSYKWLISHLVIEFNIGEIDFTSSREQLAYTEKTIKNVKARLEEYGNWLINSIEKELDKESSIFMAGYKIEQVMNKYKNLIHMPKLKYKGQELFYQINEKCLYIRKDYSQKVDINPVSLIKIDSRNRYILMRKGSITAIKKYVKDLPRFISVYLLTEEIVKKYGIDVAIDSNRLKEPSQKKVEKYYTIGGYGHECEKPEDGYFIPKIPSKHYNYFGIECNSNRIHRLEATFGIKIYGYNKMAESKIPEDKKLSNFIINKRNELEKWKEDNKELIESYYIRKNFSDYIPGTNKSLSDMSIESELESIKFFQSVYNKSKNINLYDKEIECSALQISFYNNIKDIQSNYNKHIKDLEKEIAELVLSYIKGELNVSV